MQQKEDTDRKLNRYAAIATVAGAAAALASLLSGYIVFQATSAKQADDRAVELVAEYFKLRAEDERTTPSPCQVPASPECVWRASFGMLVAESVFYRVPDSRAWEATVRGIIRDHEQFLVEVGICHKQFGAGFVRLVKEEVPQAVLLENCSNAHQPDSS